MATVSSLIPHQKLHLALSQLAQDLFHCPLLPRVVQVQAVFTFQTLNQRAHPGEKGPKMPRKPNQKQEH